MSGSKLRLNHIYVQFVSTSYLFQNFWMESLCMFKLFILHFWFKTFGWNLPVCSICQYFMSGSKLGWNHTMLNLSAFHVWFKTFGWKHPVCSACLFHIWFKKFRLNHLVCSACLFFMSDSKLLDGIFLYVKFISTSCLAQNFYIESHHMFDLSVLQVWFTTFGWNHLECSTYQYFMSDSKLFDWTTLYV